MRIPHHEPVGVWMGLKRCGCPVAVATDAPDIPRRHLEQSKRDFLKSGLQVVYASWDEWRVKWSPIFMKHCEHDPKPTTQASLLP